MRIDFARNIALKSLYETVLSFNNVIGLNIATRPDAISEECLDYLEELNKKNISHHRTRSSNNKRKNS